MKNADAAQLMTKSDASTNVVLHHLSSFQNNDLQAVISDYTNESVLITQQGTYKGPEEIKVFFTDLMVHFSKQDSDFVLDKLVAKDGLVFIIWHAKTPSVEVTLGSDTFILKDGKIDQQTFVGQMKFIN